MKYLYYNLLQSQPLFILTYSRVVPVYHIRYMGVIDVIVSNDSDVIVLGAKRLVRPANTLFDTDYIRDQMGFSQRQWDDFLVMCKNMRELDVVLAYSLISVYKRKEMAVERWEEVNGKLLMR